MRYVLAFLLSRLVGFILYVASDLVNSRKIINLYEVSAMAHTQNIDSASGVSGLKKDWSSDKEVFNSVSWGKGMMWIFLLSDTFIFSCFLISYMTVRITDTVNWPIPSEVFALEVFGTSVPLILIAIMTFILITSSGTMAMAVNMGYRRDKKKAALLLILTAILGASFVGMQAFEWSKLISEGVRPWGNPMGSTHFGAAFFMITGFHGLHVSAGVIYLLWVAQRVLRGHYDKSGDYVIVEIVGLYWHFVDLVWVFIFAFFYLW